LGMRMPQRYPFYLLLHAIFSFFLKPKVQKWGSGLINCVVDICKCYLKLCECVGQDIKTCLCSLYLVCALYVVYSSAIDLLGWLLLSSTAVRFWSGFTRTTYNSSASTKLGMTALWPGAFLSTFLTSL